MHTTCALSYTRTHARIHTRRRRIERSRGASRRPSNSIRKTGDVEKDEEAKEGGRWKGEKVDGCRVETAMVVEGGEEERGREDVRGERRRKTRRWRWRRIILIPS